MRRTIYRVIIIVASTLAFNLTKAHAVYYETNQILVPHQWFVDIGIGKSYDYGSSSVPVTLTGSSDYMLFQTDQAATPPFFSAAIGHLWDLQTDYLPFISVGLQYHYTTPVVITGDIYEALPNNTINFEQSLYSRYQIKQQSCSILTKLDIYRWQNLMPYFAFGMGASWNRINHFSTLAFVPVLDPLNLSATANTTSDFTYSLGVGIDYLVNPELWLSLGYAYDDFGKNGIGQLLKYVNAATPLQPISAFVNNASLHAHNILFTARYLFA